MCVFIDLARGLVVIEGVPEDETQVLINFQRVVVRARLKLVGDAVQSPGLRNNLGFGDWRVD